MYMNVWLASDQRVYVFRMSGLSCTCTDVNVRLASGQ